MDIYIPFTYIIGWSKYKRFYYGCKYAKGCQPSDLWESYFTSSEYVQEFREQLGEPDIIRIHRTFCEAKECVEFEYKYLTKINAKDNPLFLNKTNGCYNMGPISKEEKEKRIKTWIKKYDADHPMKCPMVVDKLKQTFINVYGVENPSQVSDIQEKKKNTWLKNYGVDHPSKSETIKKKISTTWKERYSGSENIENLNKILERIKQTNLNNYNVEWSSQAECVKEKIVQTWIINHGVDNPSKIMKICSHCGEFKNIQHESKCTENPNRNMWDRNGEKNGRAKTFLMINTITNESYIVKGGIKRFCKEMEIPPRRLNKDKYPDYFWKQIEIKD